MPLPEDLINSLAIEFNKIPQAKLAMASEELTQRYRGDDRDKRRTFMTEDMHRLAYLAVRLPATYAVVCRVLEELKARMPNFRPETVCDIGAGPGTATWAALQVFPEIAFAALHEKDGYWLEMGARLMKQSQYKALQTAKWWQSDIQEQVKVGLKDLIILSYVVGELPVDKLLHVISQAWNDTSKVLVVIEPGTPHGFERIRLIRAQLINSGAYLVAPCPHQQACPMSGGDWCHFSQRLERSALHRNVKEGALGYEDEKYAYVIAAREFVELPEARVLRHPQKHSGHIDLTLCTKEGLEERTISRRHGDLYKKSRKIEWGDVW